MTNMPVSPRITNVAPLAGERVGLNPPPSPGQLREPGPELGRRELEPAVEIDEPEERFERLGGKTRDREAGRGSGPRVRCGRCGRRRLQCRTRISGAARTTIHHASSPIIS